MLEKFPQMGGEEDSEEEKITQGDVEVTPEVVEGDRENLAQVGREQTENETLIDGKAETPPREESIDSDFESFINERAERARFHEMTESEVKKTISLIKTAQKPSPR